MSDPTFSEDLQIKYIVINTGYNNRALANTKCCNLIYDAMGAFDELELDTNADVDFYEENEDADIIKDDNSSVYTIKHCRNIRLLYTIHSGYTWIDIDIDDNPMYTNGNDVTYINNVRDIFKQNGIDDVGCFVFELPRIINVIFSRILLQFVGDLTEAKFCGFFSLNTITDVKYYEDTNTIVFDFDTESG